LVKRWIRGGLLVVLVIGLGWLALALWPTPEKAVRKRLDHLAQLISVNPLDLEETREQKARTLAALFTATAVVRVDVQGGPHGQVTGREEIYQVVRGAQTMVGALSAEFLDVVVRLSGDGRTATVEATGKAAQPGVREVFWQELRFHFILQDGAWYIQRVETVRTLTLFHGVQDGVCVVGCRS
jgi:hypothetical protein